MTGQLSRQIFWVVVFSFIPSILLAQDSKNWLKYKYPTLTIDNQIWIGTPRGLYQYFTDEDSWAVYGEHNGLPSNDIEILNWDGEELWVSTPGGLASGNISLNKWLIYTEESGLPSNRIYSLAFQEDYVWIGTDRGAARFDKLIQEWEIFSAGDGIPDSLVFDISIDGDLVYFATAKGLAEYDIQFEKWRYYTEEQGILSDTIRFIYPTTEYLWLFTPKGVSRFNKRLRTAISFDQDSRLKYPMILDFAEENDRFWLATREGILIYDPGSGLWRDFQDGINLPSQWVESISVSAQERWFITDNGVASFDEETRSWQTYDASRGVSAEDHEAVVYTLGRAFLLHENGVDYTKPLDTRWYLYTFISSSQAAAGEGLKVSLDREKGSYVRWSPDYILSLSGSRWTSRFQRLDSYLSPGGEHLSSSESAHRGDLKAQLTLPGGRTINGFYNNTDFSQVVYGVRYKGTANDFVQEGNWGDVRYEQGKHQLVPSLGIFGASARLEAGPKTSRYKRSFISATGWTGQRTTASEQEFFTGNMEAKGVTIRDTDYLKNTFYLADTTGLLIPLEPGSDRIYVDDKDPATNTANTHIASVLDGVAGDYDLYQPIVHYTIDTRSGIIRFSQPVTDTSTIALEAVSSIGPVQKVIKHPGTVDQTLVNRYFIGAMEIIPASFQLQITDTLGLPYPLSDFGLDTDNDGKVDPDRMDYQDGILAFPDMKPFPAAVYDPENAVSQFHLRIRFESRITIFNLLHSHLVRGSETVIVDGDPLMRGEDYVLDNTSGTLLILKQGVVAEDSEIEVSYEYYEDTREKFHRAGIGFGPSDDVQMDVHYTAYDHETPNGGVTESRGWDFFGEFKKRIGDVDLKLTPQFAQNQSEGREGKSMHIRGDVSSRKVRLSSTYESYEKEYQPLFAKKFQLGILQNRLSADGTVFLLPFLDVSAGWSKMQSHTDTDGNRGVEENLSGKILLNKQYLPAFSLFARSRTLQKGDSLSTKQTIKGDMEYQVPAHLLKKLSLRTMRIYGVWRSSWEDKEEQDSTGRATSKRRYINQYLRMDVSPADRIQINAYYRGAQVHSHDFEGDEEYHPLNSQQTLFFDTVIDRLRGVNINMRYQTDLSNAYSTIRSENRDISFSRTFQSSFRIFPGQWLRFLTPVTFEVNVQPTWKGYLRNATESLKLTEALWRPADSDMLKSSEENTLYQIRGEWRPTSTLVSYTRFERYTINSQTDESLLKTTVNKFNQKIEYRPSNRIWVTLQYFRNQENKDNATSVVRDNPMIWFENRWSSGFLTKINLSYLQEEKQWGNIQEKMSTLSPLVGLTLRFFKPGVSRVVAELRDDLSMSFYHHNGLSSLETHRYSNALAFDLYPLSVFILRFRWVLAYEKQFHNSSDDLSNTLELRLTAQL